tara:strand:- start:128 stop:601 length:474 start_codon:yes stop_codon:yes gene_type:complete
MIEVLALASAVSTIAGGISSAIQAGKDVNSVMPAFGKLADLEAQIGVAEAGKHKGPIGRLSLSQQEGFAIASAKIAHKEAMDQLRSDCRLYGSPGLWEAVVHETAKARKRHKDALEAQAAKRDRMFYFITVVISVLIFGLGAAGLFWGAAILAEDFK